jgi:GNAT superfamily N-acetyltransferase
VPLHVHSLAGDDPARYLAYEPSSVSDVSDRFDRYLAAGNFRPEWLWLAERDGHVVARAAFWGRPIETSPAALDHFDIKPGTDDAVRVGAELLTAAYAGSVTAGERVPDHHMFLPPHWRDHPDADAVRLHLAAASEAGLTELVERHRLRWLSDMPLAAPVRRLRMSTATDADDDLLVALLVDIGHGSLDVGMGREVAEHGPTEAARRYLADMSALDASREHWLLGYDAAGALAGVAMGARTPQQGIVGFVGVAPAHRGNGYARELLVSVTEHLAAAGVTEARADTDFTNTPMVGTFAAAGWEAWGTRLVLQGPPIR